jgi:hypothetical protein
VTFEASYFSSERSSFLIAYYSDGEKRLAVQRFKVPGSEVQRFRGSKVQRFKGSRFRDSGVWVQGSGSPLLTSF